MLQILCRPKRLRSVARYRIEIAEYLEKVSDGRVEDLFFPGRNIGTRIGPSGPRTFDSEFFHARLQSGSFESEVFGCTILATDLPVACRQHFFDVCSFNLFDRFACLFMRPKRNNVDVVLAGEPVA